MSASQTSSLKTFYTILVTQTISLIGSRLSSFVIGIYVYQQTGNVTPLAMISFFATLPYIFGSSLAGVFADRYDRRKIMVIADTGAAIGTLFLMIVFATGTFQIWHVYLVGFWQSLCSTFQQPAFGASVSMLVPDEHRNRANAARQMSDPAAGILAPALAGVLYAIVGVGGVLVIDLISFFVAVFAVYLAHIPKPTVSAEGQAGRGSMLKEMGIALRFIWDRKPLMILVSCAMLINFLLNGTGTLNTAYVLSRSNDDTVLLGLISGVMSAGGLLGAVIFGVWGGTRTRIHTIMPAIMLCGLGVAAFGLSQSAVPLLISGLCIMMFPPMANAGLGSILQGKIPMDMQGRVIGLLSTFAMLMAPISILLVGPLADNVFIPFANAPAWGALESLFGTGAAGGLGLLITIGGLVTFVVTAAFYALPSIRSMERTLPTYEANGEVTGGDPEPEPQAAAAA